MSDYSLPPRSLLEHQAAWLAPARQRLLRRVGIARRRRVLDLAAGFGAATGELALRSSGLVTALDRCRQALRESRLQQTANLSLVVGDAEQMPFADGSFDLVYCQFALLWMNAAAVIREVWRVLKPEGTFAAIEPDYGGMIEYPPEIATREIWLSAISRAGGEACIGRRLLPLLVNAGFCVHIQLSDRLVRPSALRLDFLAGMPLSPEEQAALSHVRQVAAELDEQSQVAHLPLFLVVAEKN